jgi:putative PIN family toxin of toxin-antitoxin system
MNTDTVGNPIRIVLDTNVLVSAVTHIGIPRDILFLALEKKIQTVTSPILIVELLEVLGKKFKIVAEDLQRIEKEIRQKFIIVYPRETITIQIDDADNRVLEAAVQGDCQLIIAGDRELLKLARYKSIDILSPKDFIESMRIKKD